MDDGGGTPNPLVNRPTVIIGFGTEGWIAQFAGSGSFEGVQPKLGNVAVAGLNRKATRLTRGAISLSSSSHLPANVGSITMKHSR